MIGSSLTLDFWSQPASAWHSGKLSHGPYSHDSFDLDLGDIPECPLFYSTDEGLIIDLADILDAVNNGVEVDAQQVLPEDFCSAMEALADKL